MSQVENKTIYIKASQSKQVTNKRIILSDVLDIISLDNDAVKRAGDIVLHTVKGDKNEKVISGLKRISKPGLRVYASKDELPKVLGGLGIAIISTNQGVVTDKEARKLNVGGEVLAFVW